jgi:capsular exopolysaccharide synthesis family protein
MPETGEVQLHFLDYWRVVKNRWGIITLTFLLVVITAYITSTFLPKEYFSHVRLEVKGDDYKMTAFGGSSDIRDMTDTRFAVTQFQILQSKEIMYPVIDELHLIDKWSMGDQKLPKEQVHFRVLKMMDLKDIRGTNLIDIGVWSIDPQESANIANTIALQYQKRRIEDQSQIISQGLAELKEEVEKQRIKTEQARELTMKIRDRDGVVDNGVESSPDVAFTETQTVNTAEQALEEARQNVDGLRNQLVQLNKMTQAEFITGAQLFNVTDATISKILPLYQDTVAEEARLTNSGLGENHPRLKSLRAQKSVYAQQLSDQVSSLRKSLESRLALAETTLTSKQESKDDITRRFNKLKNQSADYTVAKNNWLQQKRILESAESGYETKRIEFQMTNTPAKIWEKAEPAIVPGRPNIPIFMSIATLVGLIWGIGLAFFLEYLDTSVKTMADVEKFIGVSVLAVVPKIAGLLYKQEGRQPDMETYRTLRTNIEFHKSNPSANTIAVISGGPGEGKSTTLANLAYICATAGSNVLIIDGDLRRPSQHKCFDMDNGVGLADYINGDAELEAVILPTSIPNISLITSGPVVHDPVAILNSPRMADLIAKAKAHYDLVLIDSPPVLGLSDGTVLSSLCEITLMVVQHRRFPRSSLLRVKQAIMNVGGNLAGVVLNKVDTRDDANYYYYTSYYDYYTDRDRSPGPKKAVAQQTDL